LRKNKKKEARLLKSSNFRDIIASARVVRAPKSAKLFNTETFGGNLVGRSLLGFF